MVPSEATELVEEAAHGACARCRGPVGGEGSSWVFRRLFSQSLTIVWFCARCAPEDLSRCAVCGSPSPLARIPLCGECLFVYEAEAAR
ncbi:MAG: hypothetical protein HYZ28_18985 [Myxococcales bacterium]|nr:hypothetical protein [Myxococcales bacterium]